MQTYKPKRPCGCGCGQLARGIYRRGHKPISTYRGTRDPMKRLHQARAEAALGRPLPPKAVVHHADGSKNDNAPLVICQDQRYHGLLHSRMRVKAAGGNPNTDFICSDCRCVVPRTLAADRTRPWPYSGRCRDCQRLVRTARRLRRQENAINACAQ